MARGLPQRRTRLLGIRRGIRWDTSSSEWSVAKNPVVEAKKPEIIALCRRFGVVKLDLFGSATGPNWDPDRSDFDFVVDFDDYGPGIAARFLDFRDD